MIEFVVGLLVICGMCWLGYKITGALLTAIFWLFVKLPLALILLGIGIVFCVSIIFIPLGIGCIKTAGGLVV